MSHVLIIDDDPTILSIVASMLQAAGHQSTTYSDSGKALEILETRTFDCVVLDLNMPAPDGFNVLQKLRSAPGSSSTPILILSGRTDPEDGARAIRGGADDFVVKPFEPTELVVRIERLVERNQAEDTSLTGRLEALSPKDLLQNLCQGRKTGLLLVADSSEVVEVHINEGQILSAHLGSLRDMEALLVLLEKETGIFRFEPGAPQNSPPLSVESLDLNKILLDAAWLEDELARRLRLMPAEDHVLQVTAPLPSDPPESGSINLPFDTIHQRLSSQPALSYEQLLSCEIGAPKVVTLALVLLIEAGVVQARLRPPSRLSQVLSLKADETAVRQPHPKMDLSAALNRLRRSTDKLQGGANGNPETLHLLLFYDAPVWDRLLNIVEAIPETFMPADRSRLLDQLQLRRSGTLRLVEPEGKVLIYLQPLNNRRQNATSALSFASATIAWLEDTEIVETLATLARSLCHPNRPLCVIASSPTLPDRLHSALEGMQPIRISKQEPHDLSDLLLALPVD